MWTFDVNYVTQNNSYVQLLAILCVLQALLCDVYQTSMERFMKPTAVRDFCDTKMSLSLHYQNSTG